MPVGRLTSVPPVFEEAMGYFGQARYVGFYWEPAGDELMVDDGRTSFTGEWGPFRVLMNHPATFPIFAPYDFGSSDGYGPDMLVLDRETREASVLKVAEARRLLRDQHPAPSAQDMVLQVDAEEMGRLIHEGLKQMQAVTVAPNEIDMDIEGRIAEQRNREAKFLGWLDEL